MTAQDTCAATSHCAHYPDVGHYCRGHFERLGAILRDIEDQTAALSAVPSMAIRHGSTGGSPAFSRSPVRLDVLVHTDPRHGAGWSETDDELLAAGNTMSVSATLHGWARLVREERGFATRAAATVASERDTLTRHLEHIAHADWANACYHALAQLLGQLKAANGTAEEKPVGRCYLPTVDGTCDGPVWVDSAAGHAHCGRCQQTWDGPQLAMLSYELERAKRPTDTAGQPLWTTAEIATEQGVKDRTIATWAHRHGITSTDGYWDPADFRRQAVAV